MHTDLLSVVLRHDYRVSGPASLIVREKEIERERESERERAREREREREREGGRELPYVCGEYIMSKVFNVKNEVGYDCYVTQLEYVCSEFHSDATVIHP